MTHPYATRHYAQSLAHVGEPVHVPEWDCWLLRREIAPDLFDAVGAYPLAVLPKEADIAAGLARLKDEGMVSLVFVLDDFHRPVLEEVRPFAALLKPYKTHYLYRPQLGEIVYAEHHRRALKKAASVEVKMLPLAEVLPAWCGLYDYLIEQLELTGLHAFPHAHHAQLATLEGVVAACGFVEGELASCHVWVEHGGYVHSHLVASSARGYDARAGFAVNHASLQHFAGITLINFGGGVGLAENPDDGLARFKRGFANDTAQSYLCGFILDEARYQRLSEGKAAEFFPAYRG